MTAPRRRPVITMGVALAAAVAMLVAGCSDDDGEAEGADAGPARSGAEVYRYTCAICHGEDLRGTPRGPSHLSEIYGPDQLSDAAFRKAIEEGVTARRWRFGDMPPRSDLSDAEIEAVIAYIRDQQETHGLEPYPPR